MKEDKQIFDLNHFDTYLLNLKFKKILIYMFIYLNILNTTPYG